MSDYCFVIQPFDGGKFDKRYNDVFKPALQKISVESYRIDNDPSENILIESIEEKIKDSRFCLADITTDNPNVWYEVGYALALGKDVILVCSNERTNDYPFDIRHRKIINYKVESSSDFESLAQRIVERSSAILKQPIILASPVNINLDIDGLNYQEISLLGAILKNQDTPSTDVPAWEIKEEMKRSGLNEIAFNLSARKLLLKKMIDYGHVSDYNGNDYEAYNITEVGDKWVLENINKFDFNITEVEVRDIENKYDVDDLPF